jgi:class 3 adenylate cyclase
MSAAAVASGYIEFGRHMELSSLDLRYRMRPTPEMLPQVGFIDIGDTDLAMYGEWPWSRAKHVALVRTLGYYRAAAAAYDVFFVEKQDRVFVPGRIKEFFKLDTKSGAKTAAKSAAPAAAPGVIKSGAHVEAAVDASFRDYDGEFSVALKEAGNIYLSLFSTRATPELEAEGLAAVLKKTSDVTSKFTPIKREAVARAEKTFLPLSDKTPALRGQLERLPKVIDLDPPLPELTDASKGIGFAQPGLDEDSRVRHYVLFRYYNGRLVYPVVLKMMSDILDFKLEEMEIHPAGADSWTGKGDGRVVIKNALDFKTGKRHDIEIPIDGQSHTLLDWAGKFDTTYLHVPYNFLARRYAYLKAEEILRGLRGSGASYLSAYGRVYEALIEDDIVPSRAAADTASRMAAAYVIASAPETDEGESMAVKSLEKHLPADVLNTVEMIVSAARGMTAALEADPNTGFESFDLSGIPQERKAHLLEVFNNIKWLVAAGRKTEIFPYYFAPAGTVVQNGAVVPFSPLDLENKVFMIGLTGANTVDLNPTPFEESCPMVAYHVNAVNAFLKNRFLRHPPWGFKEAAATALALVMSTAGVFMSVPAVTAFFAASAAAYLAVTYRLWAVNGLWLEWVVPLTALVFSYLAVVVMQLVRMFREKRKLRGFFAMMVSPSVLKVMEDNPDRFSLTGERKAATTFFSMIDGIKDVTKSVPPNDLAALLGVYLTPNSEIIMDYDGYVDKYEGHVIMADFGVPLDDSENPWKCAFSAVQQTLDIESFKYFVRARYGMDVAVSMGFNFGWVSAGNMGSERKFQYTVMGDPVNVAARYMAANFIYNSTNPITGQDTVPEISGAVYLRKLDKILLKGKTRPTVVYDVPGWRPEAYMELRARVKGGGVRAVPEYLKTVWGGCPPGKIFGYHAFWSSVNLRTSHPVAASIAGFFTGQLDIAARMMAMEWKSELLACDLTLKTMRARLGDFFKTDFTPHGAAPDAENVLSGWVLELERIEKLLSSDRMKTIYDKAALEEIEGDVRILLNRVGMLRHRMENSPSMEERIDAAVLEARRYIGAFDEADGARIAGAMTAGSALYRKNVAAFFETIGRGAGAYHEMMSIAGSPSSAELESARLHEEGLEHYWARRWDPALEKFEASGALISGVSGMSGPAASFIRRINAYKAAPPDDNWQGEFIQTKK